MSRRIVDLTLTIEEGMTTFPVHWHPFVEITMLGRHGMENRETRKLVLGTHTGTHIDAPRHFVRDGETIENIPLDPMVGPAAVLDFHDAPDHHEVDLKQLQAAIGDRPLERLLLRFDWDRHLRTNAYYSNHPFLSEEACEWLVARGCRMIAMDTPMPDNPVNGRGTPKDSPNHVILLGAGVLIVEYLCNLRSLTQEVVELVVAPLKIHEGDGAPARVFAIEETA